MKQDHFQEESIDLKKLFFKYLPYWYVFAICLFVAVAAAHLYNRYSEPVYRVKSTVLIREDRNILPFLGELDVFSSRSNWFNETAILSSYSLVDSVIRSMDLGVSYYATSRYLGSMLKREVYHHAPFRVVWDKEHPQPFDEAFMVTMVDANTYRLEARTGNNGLFRESTLLSYGEELSGEEHSFYLELRMPFDPQEHPGSTFLFSIHDPTRIADRYLSGLSVDPMGQGFSIVEVTFEATHLQRALDFINTLTSTYIQQGLNEKNQTARNTIYFIDEQIAITTDSLFLAESNLQDFRQQHQLMDVSFLANQLLTELQTLDKQRAVENVKRQYYDYLLEYVREEKDFSEVFGPSALGIDDPVLNNLLVELSKLHAERARLQLTTTGLSPSIQTIDLNIMQAKRSLEENITSIKAASDIMIRDLNSRIRQIERRINELPQTERELISIQRMFNLNDATYNFLLEKRAEAGIALASNIPDHKIVDPARFIGAVAPKRTLNYAIALVLGLALPFSFLLLRDFFNTRIIDKQEVTDALDLPILGVIPHHDYSRRKQEVNLVVFDYPRSPILEAFRTMRSNLQFFATEEKSKIIVVTSTRSMEGKTFTAINLASAIALSGKRTVLLGGDMRKPKIFNDFKLPREPGLSNYLIGKSSLEDILQPATQDPHLFVIASGPVPPNPAELLEGPAMLKLLEALKNQFDYIVVDTPPLGLVSDGQALLRVADLGLFVIRQRFTHRSALDFIRDMSQKVKTKNLCVEINDVKMSKLGYGYGAGYGYGYGYGQGYYGEEDPAGDKTGK
jgi:capsular exopolysaccharide synthesis family protein